ncbi:MAG: LptF/LptG family permease [Bacteroidales bacterium]|jgi:lipopolysaccharide export system permease protein|nr:LptF/LptG family permease [Bacteroidales bacterium]
MIKLKPTILDRYIIKKFIGTYLSALLVIIGIVIIFDISEKIDNFVQNQAPFNEIVFKYYANFIPYFVNMFSPLFVFITVIFFTSKLAANSEIIAILSGGISFNRLLYPYVLSAIFITIFSLILNLYIIPPANKGRLAFENKYVKKQFVNTDRNIHYQINPGEFLYLESFSNFSKSGTKFTLEKMEGHRMLSKLSAENAVWDTLSRSWKLYDYYHRKFDERGRQTITQGAQMDTLINLTYEDLSTRANVVETLSFHELNDMIAIQELRGDKMVKFALIEKHTRLALPFAAIILTIMGVALSSRKRRGGIGMNIGIGIALSFSYILFLRFSQMFVHSGILPPLIALWVPNMLYGAIAYFLYRIAPK